MLAKNYSESILHLSHPHPAPYPGVPEELGEDHQGSRVQGETHVGRGDRQHGNTALGRMLEPVTQLLPLG